MKFIQVYENENLHDIIKTFKDNHTKKDFLRCYNDNGYVKLKIINNKIYSQCFKTIKCVNCGIVDCNMRCNNYITFNQYVREEKLKRILE